MLRWAIAAAAAIGAAAPASAYRLEDPLRGGTRGNPVGGAFESGGWRVTAPTDRIWYALPRLARGSIEVTISDLTLQNLVRSDNEILAMYEGGYGIREPIRYSPEFRENHYKVMLRIYGTEETGRVGLQKLMWGMCPSGAPGYGACACDGMFAEPFGGNGSWDGSPQRLRIEWGDGVTRYLRNGTVVYRIGWEGHEFGPEELHFSLGTSRPSAVGSAALPVGALFSDLVVEGTEGPVATCPGPPVPDDDAAIDAARLPTALRCGEAFAASVTVRNTGADTWSPGEGYRLGATDDSDPLSQSRRVDLPGDLTMRPGATHAFNFEIRAPAQPGTYVTAWRMLRENVHWFGETARSTVAVTCDVPRDGGASDAGSVDGGPVDAGAGVDAGVGRDAGVGGDAGAEPPGEADGGGDVFTPADGGAAATPSGGCDGAGGAGWVSALLALLAAWAARRRAARSIARSPTSRRPVSN
jgi:hypothetical protein